MSDRVHNAIGTFLCILVGIPGGFMAGAVVLAVYLLASLLLGTGISESIPVLVERITVPLGMLTGLVIGLVAE